MSRFLATFLIVYSAMHIYAFTRVRSAFHPGLAAAAALAVFMVITTCIPLIVRLVEQKGLETAARFFSWTGYTWMGFLFLFVSMALIVDLYRLGIWATGLALKQSLPAFALAARAAFLLPFFPALILTGYGLYEAGDIRTERLTISSPKIPAAVGKITIAQISDVHVGLIVRARQLGKIVEAVKKANPDVLVATGDLVDGQINHLDGLSTLLAEIRPRYGKFAVTGNHEFFAGIDQSLDFMRRAGFTILRNEWVDVAGTVAIAGVDDPVAGRFGPSPLPLEKDLLRQLPGDQFRLLLKHRPDIIEGELGLFDLQLSGHTHRGQIFPFNFLVKSSYPYLSGRFDLTSGSFLYVNRGSGTWGPPLRLLSPPEVTIIELVPGG